MRAICYTCPGYGLFEVPKPYLTKEDDVLVRIAYAGICGSDMRMKKLGNSENLRPPVVVGHEFAGVIKAVGKKT